MTNETKRRILIFRLLRPLLLCAAVGALPAANAAAAIPAGRTDPTHQQAQNPRLTRIETQIAALTKALDLDFAQQTKLKAVLTSQAEEIDKVWKDPAVPSAYRISATRAISNHTADEIRALLTDEQKKKYNPPRQPHEAAKPAAPALEAWMNTTNSQ